MRWLPFRRVELRLGYMPSAAVVGWKKTAAYIGYLFSKIKRLRARCVSFHAHTTVSTTEVSLLPVLVLGPTVISATEHELGLGLQTFQAVTERNRGAL